MEKLQPNSKVEEREIVREVGQILNSLSISFNGLAGMELSTLEEEIRRRIGDDKVVLTITRIATKRVERGIDSPKEMAKLQRRVSTLLEVQQSDSTIGLEGELINDIKHNPPYYDRNLRAIDRLPETTKKGVGFSRIRRKLEEGGVFRGPGRHK